MCINLGTGFGEVVVEGYVLLVDLEKDKGLPRRRTPVR